jgi:hypothetical protein
VTPVGRRSSSITKGRKLSGFPGGGLRPQGAVGDHWEDKSLRNKRLRCVSALTSTLARMGRLP